MGLLLFPKRTNVLPISNVYAVASSRTCSFARSIPCALRGSLARCYSNSRPTRKRISICWPRFLAKLPLDIRCAFEFRNKTWLVDEVYRLLELHRVALCLAESEKFEVPEVVTADFVYVRLRKEDYSSEERAEILQRVKRQLADGRDVYCFFKHEDTPAGARYAEELLHSAAAL